MRKITFIILIAVSLLAILAASLMCGFFAQILATGFNPTALIVVLFVLGLVLFISMGIILLSSL